MKASDLLTRRPITVQPDATICDAYRRMDDAHVRHLPVLDGDEIVGMLSDRDVLASIGRARRSPEDICREMLRRLPSRVDQIMSTPVRSIHPDTPLRDIAALLLNHCVTALPVLDDDGLAGIITRSDLLRWYRDLRRSGDGFSPTAEPVADHMTPDPVTVAEDDGARDVVRRMIDARVKHLPVVRDRRLVGIISDRDVRLALGIPLCECRDVLDREECFNGRSAATMMTRDPVTLAPADPLARAADAMLAGRFSSVPILDEAQLLGIVTDSDVVRRVLTLESA